MKLRESDHPSGGDAEAANGRNGDAAADLPSHHPTTLLSQRWGYLLLLSLAVVYMTYEIGFRSGVELSTVKGVVHGRKDDAGYEPLVGKSGEIYHASMRDANPSNGANGGNGIGSNQNGGGRPPIIPPPKPGTTHPRVTCFVASGEDISYDNCNPHDMEYALDEDAIDSMPETAKTSGKGSSKSDDVTDLYAGETDECKLADPSYQALPAAPSTCNDVHALGFRFGPSKHEPVTGMQEVYPSRHTIKYLTSGGFRSVWTVSLLDEREVPSKVILKTNMLRRGWSSYYLDQNRRDVLISERAGGMPEALFDGLTPIATQRNGKGGVANSNVLPIYQYCAFSSVVPFATAGVLDDYVHDRRYEEDFMTAEEIFVLALMAARGLYQAQLFHDGRATHVHADVKPPQFLLFERPDVDAENATAQSRFPVMQLNDFNRGKFLTRSRETNETCPFRMCNVHHKGSLYRSPEEYMDCADQADTIDVYSLGGVFFYLMSDGRKPWYHVGKYKKGVEKILNGEQPRLPRIEEYDQYDKEIVARIRKRSKHPAFVALKEIMSKCWAFEPKDRPSSYDVVQMLEEKWREIDASGKWKGWSKWMNKRQ